MNGGNSNKRTVEEAPQEGGRSAKRLNVTVEVDTLDCPICFEPLSPPIFQCSVGHFICSSCRHKQLDNKCPSCSAKASFTRCFGVEHIVQAVTVPRSNAKYGCVEKVAYYKKEEHEKVCQNAPCFCPESGCGFAGPAMTLLDHLTTKHRCASTHLTYCKSVPLCVKPGLHVLRCKEVGHFFLLSVASEPFGRAISLICVQSTAAACSFRWAMNYQSIAHDYYESSGGEMRSSSLSDGLPTDYDFIQPKGKISGDQNHVMLRITIHTKGKITMVTQGKELFSDSEDDIPLVFII
ncbi:unnamed protein product [Alopecurus aequalis]